MMAAIIVVGSAVFAMAFVVAWLTRRDLRAWLETPKFQFHERVERYDRTHRDG